MNQVTTGAIVFRKAERKRAKARIALCAPAGGGKTHSALLIAKGLGGKIAVIDTENGSAELEAGKPNIPEFDVITMHAPFDPIKYIAAIDAAEKAGYDIVIIDSLTHAWAGTGGLLDKVDTISKASKSGNSYTAWRDVTPLHNKLVDKMLQSTCHIIATMRSKTDYVLETNSKGGMTPKKVGLAPVQREGMDYEFTVVLDIDQSSHVATATKDRTSLFDGAPFVPSPDTGEMLLNWFNSGKAEETPAAPEPAAPAEQAAQQEHEPQAEPEKVVTEAKLGDKAMPPQLNQIREYAKTSAAVMDDENLVKWLSLMFDVNLKKVTDMSKQQAEEVLTAIKELEGAPNVE